MFGFEFLENFNYPYISKSVTEFWRAGISRCPPGSATMCAFRWAATGARPHGTFSICSPDGLRACRLCCSTSTRCFFIVIGWVFFRSDSMGLAVQYLGSMFTSTVPLNRFVIEYLLRFWPYLLFGVVLSAPVFPCLKSTRIWRVLEFPVLAVLFTLCLVRLLANSYNPFIYFRF